MKDILRKDYGCDLNDFAFLGGFGGNLGKLDIFKNETCRWFLHILVYHLIVLIIDGHGQALPGLESEKCQQLSIIKFVYINQSFHIHRFCQCQSSDL